MEGTARGSVNSQALDIPVLGLHAKVKSYEQRINRAEKYKVLCCNTRRFVAALYRDDKSWTYLNLVVGEIHNDFSVTHSNVRHDYAWRYDEKENLCVF